MTERQRLSGRASFGLAAGALAILLVAGVYVTRGGEGNGADDACAAAAPTAKSLAPLVGGEIAALQIATAPKDLSALAFSDAEGRPKTLADFKGRVALVNLWATWCAPCRKEMPALDRLSAAFAGEDFNVVPVSIDIGEPARAAEFLESIGVRNLPLYTDRSTEIFNSLKRRGMAIGLPVTVLLNRNGCTLGHMNGPAEWDGEDGRKLIEATIRATASPSDQGQADQATRTRRG